MSLNWNDIRARAAVFATDWATETRERGEAQTFWNAFFEVFGLSRRRLAGYDVSARRTKGGVGFIDMFWPRVVIVEHKSRGENLDRAYKQAVDYFDGIRPDDLPKYVLVSDFARFRLHNLDDGAHVDFALADLPDNVSRFAFMLGQKVRVQAPEDPVNDDAAILMGTLHDALAADHYTGHDLEVFLVRTMFCLFADDTGIFTPQGHFQYLIEQTRPDGSDLGPRIGEIFQTLNMADARRSPHLDGDLALLQYVNGNLFAEVITTPVFTAETRILLLNCCRFDWSKVSPAVFGAMFQAVMDGANRDMRRRLGAHYTSETNIMKVVRSLFLDALAQRFADSRNHPEQLQALLSDMRSMRFFDPACGCGNFLLIAYREVRLLEIDIYVRLAELTPGVRQQVIDAGWIGIDVDALHGIEIEEFPARIAESAIYLMDHLMNMRLSAVLGHYRTRLPLDKAPKIRHGNALDLDWTTVCPREETVVVARRASTRFLPVYVLGNPPFIGKKRRTSSQKADMTRVCGAIDGYGDLDYVCCWYIRAAAYIAGSSIPCAFVSTNSIVQGEQVSLLFGYLLNQGISIRFAHRTFQWANEARANANVYVVIIGFAHGQPNRSQRLPLYDYETPDSETPVLVEADHINPYLINFPNDTMVVSRQRPLCSSLPIVFGNMPNDNGNLLLTNEKKLAMVAADPRTEAFIKPLLSADEMIKGELRWCIWLDGVSSASWLGVPLIVERVERVRAIRLASTRGATQRLAEQPYRFGEVRQPVGNYLIIPRHSSEHRRYIPMIMATPDQIAADSCVIVPGATPYLCGVLMSEMHMAWIRHVCGRLESRFRYSNTIVYNNFPWPDADEAAKAAIGAAATTLMDVVRAHLAAGETLAEIYNPLAMPADLITGHRNVSRAVDRAYATRQSLANDRDRMQFLLARYARLVAPIAPDAVGAVPAPVPRRRGRSSGSGR